MMTALCKWFIENKITANLLMIAMILGGIYSALTIKKEVFPATISNFVAVTMSYPGASAEEVEERIVNRIESAIAELPGIKKITSVARYEFASISVEVIEGYPVNELRADIKSNIDSIADLPAINEKPVISNSRNRSPIMFFALYGDVPYKTLKETGYQIADEMSMLDGISEVKITGGLNKDEISIEISDKTLQEYALSFDEIANAIRNNSINISSGEVTTKSGYVEIKTKSQAYVGEELGDIVIRTNRFGDTLKLKDIATIKDGLVEKKLDFFYMGKPALDFVVYMSDTPDLVGGTNSANQYLKEITETLPSGLQVEIGYEMKQLFDDRLSLLTDNAMVGLLLVLAVLILFLKPVIAIWVTVGIVTTFLGTLWLLPLFGISFNMMTMFALLMLLGIVVDDAIVVGESIYQQSQTNSLGNIAALKGVKSVAKPIILAITSTVVFFVPMLDVPENLKSLSYSIFIVLSVGLFISLIESLLILPGHLTSIPNKTSEQGMIMNALNRAQGWSNNLMLMLRDELYSKALRACINSRSTTLAAFFGVLLMTIALYSSGRMNSTFFPVVQNAFIIVNVEYRANFSRDQVESEAHRLEGIVNQLKKDPHLLEQNANKQFIVNNTRTLDDNKFTIFIGLTQPEERDVSVESIIAKLKAQVGDLPQAKAYSLDFTTGADTHDMAFNVSILNSTIFTHKSAIEQITRLLSGSASAENVRSDLDSEKVELSVLPNHNAEVLGFNTQDITKKIRQSFYGEEVQRIPRPKEDVKVMLRSPLNERSEIATLNSAKIATDNGMYIPISELSNLATYSAVSEIKRVDRRRNTLITANVENGVSASEVYNQFMTEHYDDLRSQYPGLSISMEGNIKDESEFTQKFTLNLVLVLIAFYLLLVICFDSFALPSLVVIALPFSFIGAITGHYIMSMDISVMSFLGLLAACGVAVNANLVLMETVNSKHHTVTPSERITEACISRFRPIMLTTLTTFIGLIPIMSEQSVQAQFLKPMVVSLAFGVLVSSLMSLLIVPAAFMLGMDVKHSRKLMQSKQETM